ncbi:chromosome partitioning protein ParB [Caballeronia novacaledonica]|uniref:Chromosome partitioning protein ParB n=1 Tax=Caballeronia novacaledonica TaxID=1544861 RepID=A0A2U3IDB4_9BURK|nr:ParB/Srx family N-terminal domain-containing protein [Caballeronia novacaledonica]SPB18199.1 chromosome partitioning protein ParB [Caballeronia novacaledonica]
MGSETKSDSGSRSSADWVHWSFLRPTQGAIGYVQVLAKRASYLDLASTKRRSFVEQQAIKVVRGPSDELHIIDHHHWSRAWFDMGLPEAPVRIAEDFSSLSQVQFRDEMVKRGWLHPFDHCGRKISVEQLPRSVAELPDDVFQSIAAFLRMAGIYDNPGEFNAKFAWADFMRRRITVRPLNVEGFALMLAEAFKASRLPEAVELPGFIKDARQ